MDSADANFAGSIPALYDRHLGPLLFEPYAELLAERARALQPRDVLETAAGTGIVTAALARALPAARITATDLNPAMLEVAAGRLAGGEVRVRQADALDIPFEDGSFDLVVCQFGVMFYPDRPKGNAEARRVLREGGRYLLVIWDRLERNPVSRIIHDTVAGLFPERPPQFLARTPFGYSDRGLIEANLSAAGFNQIDFETVELPSRPISARDAATGLVAGSPLRAEIEERDPAGLERAIEAATGALAALEVGGRLDSPLSAHLVTATR